MSIMRHLRNFQAEQKLIGKLGEGKAHIVWAMGLYLDTEDLTTLAAECLTDKSDDKKIDFIKVDRDNGKIIFTQGYFANKAAASAPSNKAADLNTAAAWIFSGDINLIPEGLRPHIIESRSALVEGDIDTIELIYVHNLSESKNVERELKTAASHLEKIVTASSPIVVISKELGIETLERMFAAKESAIEVLDKQICPAPVLFHEAGPSWKAGVLSIPASWLHSLYQAYSDQLFSANYRGFLGNSKRKKINSTIRQTAENQPHDFWVFNNGITMLTLKMTPKEATTELKGISIINGAQTTGSLGSVDLQRHKMDGLKVLCRIIECSDKETINDIVRYNNTQNEVRSWDMYSNSADQKRIAKEFIDIGYEYVIKKMSRKREPYVDIEEVAQPLLAFHGNPRDANRGKAAIFEQKQLYIQAFEESSARHILFVLTLSRAVDELRIKLKKKSQEGTLTGLEEKLLIMMRQLRFKYFFTAVVASSVEALLGKKVDIKKVAFNVKAVKDYGVDKLILTWLDVISAVLPLLHSQLSDNLADDISDEKFKQIVKNTNALVYASQSGGPNASFQKLTELA